ncbi:exosortase H-associated membrane protein [Pseudomonas sp. RIT-PI-AD]|uniref:exosortase H-associated membrane protein n=1 Tax=Pseudomonas sp. RIT-PI-AD TaxID=3035294 RepID=UPI0021D95C47|nr:exosortase H-associated membrane protein [Pseudomonas sp. RIT-PI-AD]
MSLLPSPIICFFLRALVLLGPVLALWYWLRELLVRPAAWLAEKAMGAFFSDWVRGSELTGVSQTLLTSLQVPHASGRLAELTPEVHLLTCCYGLPLLITLLLAARCRGFWWKVLLGFMALVPFQAWSVCLSWLVAIAFHAREVTQATTKFSMLQLNLIGLGYQVGTLLLPTLIPVLLWLRLDRPFIATLMDAQLDKA